MTTTFVVYKEVKYGNKNAITILTDTQAEMAIKVLCKNRTLFVDFIELEKNKDYFHDLDKKKQSF